MPLASAFLICLLATSALAGECDRWTASMQEDEGGPLMTAGICLDAGAGNPDYRHELFIQCVGGGRLWMRYIPFAERDYPPGGDQGYKTELRLSLDREAFTAPAHYEDMDGAMAMNTTVDAPVIRAMMRGKQLVVSEAEAKIPRTTFTLDGAQEALTKLIGACTP